MAHTYVNIEYTREYYYLTNQCDVLTLPFSLGVVDMIESVPDGDESACCISKKTTRIINTSTHQTILDVFHYTACINIVVRNNSNDIAYIFLWYWL